MTGFSSPALQTLIIGSLVTWHMVSVSHADQQLRLKSPPDGVPVICPAAARKSVDAIVLARATKTGRSGEYPLVKLHIDEVLFGRIPQGAVAAVLDEDRGEKPQVIGLTTADPKYGVPYESTFQVDPQEAEGMAAWGAAQLDFHVLSAAAIFVGRNPRPAGKEKSFVEIVKTISGPPLKPGTKVLVDGRLVFDSPQQKADAIYCISEVGPDWDKPSETMYQLHRIFSMDWEPNVLAALKRRDLYPTIMLRAAEYQELHVWYETDAVRCREIIYLDDIDKALALLVSDDDDLALLGRRTLLHRRQEGRAKLLRDIEPKLVSQPPQEEGQFRKLRVQIEALGSGNGGVSQNDIVLLIDKCLAGISAGAPEPPAVKRSIERGVPLEIDAEDVNHALVWLVRTLEQPEAIRRVGPRLINARGAAPGRWRNEIQLALDVARVELSQNLSAALRTGGETPSLRSVPDLWKNGLLPESQGPGAIAFSQNGLHVAMGIGPNVLVAPIADWSAGQVIHHGAEVGFLEFSPGDKWLYVGDREIISRKEQATVVRYELSPYNRLGGNRDLSFTVPGRYLKAMSLAANGRWLITHSWDQHYKSLVTVLDTTSGRSIRSSQLPEFCSAYAIAPAFRLLMYASEGGYSLLSLGDLPAVVNSPKTTGTVIKAMYSQDEKYLLTIEESPAKPQRGVKSHDGAPLLSADNTKQRQLRVYRADKPFTLMASRKLDKESKIIDVIPGKRPAVLIDVGEIQLLALPDLAPIARTELNQGWYDMKSWASPDGRWLIARGGERDDGGFDVYSLPDLRHIRELKFPRFWGGSDLPEFSTAFSPDGKWMLLSDPCSTLPHLYRTSDFSEVVPYDDHGSPITSVYFSRDGKTTRSIAGDATVCDWDSGTMGLRQRVAPPSGYRLGSVRPSDAQYVLCPPISVRNDGLPCKLLYVTAGKIVASLPPQMKGYDCDNVLWVDDNSIEFAWLDNPSFEENGPLGRARIEIPSGRMIAGPTRVKHSKREWETLIDIRVDGFNRLSLSEDRRILWRVDNHTDGKFGWPPRFEVATFDFTSLKQLGEREILPDHHPNGPLGLVPGGRFFHLGTGIYDRQSYRLVAEEQFFGLDVVAMQFTPDGNHYAAIVDGDIYVEVPAAHFNPKTQSLLCVCETQPARIVWAHPIPKHRQERRREYEGDPLCFSPDGRRLAVAHTDGAIEVFNLPQH